MRRCEAIGLGAGLERKGNGVLGAARESAQNCYLPTTHQGIADMDSCEKFPIFVTLTIALVRFIALAAANFTILVHSCFS